MKSKVVFGNERIKKAYEKLKTSKTEDKLLFKWINRAIADLKENVFCGIQISKKLIPKNYITKHRIDNLWKYDLPQGWRLIYSVEKDNVYIITILLEWFDHKNYERRFGY